MKAKAKFTIVIEVEGDLEDMELDDIDNIGVLLADNGAQTYRASETKTVAVKSIKAEVTYSKIVQET